MKRKIYYERPVTLRFKLSQWRLLRRKNIIKKYLLAILSTLEHPRIHRRSSGRSYAEIEFGYIFKATMMLLIKFILRILSIHRTIFKRHGMLLYYHIHSTLFNKEFGLRVNFSHRSVGLGSAHLHGRRSGLCKFTNFLRRIWLFLLV